MSDIFEPEPARPSPYQEHLLTVESVESDDGAEVDQYTLQHGTCEFRDDDCLVESTVRDLGIRGALNGVWSKDPVELGSYRVRGWVSKYDVPGEPIEYDTGIELVDDDDDDE